MKKWPTEIIPDSCHVYFRVHKQYYKNNYLQPRVFRNTGEIENKGLGMSTNWGKYTTPERVLEKSREPKKNGIVKFKVSDIKKIPKQIIEHTPSSDRSHTTIFGEKDPEVRIKFSRIYEWVINL